MKTNPFFQRASFLTSAKYLNQLPEDTGAEVVFAGRSNAGKSSAINVITHQTGLARTSKTPGRTQLFNCFELTPTTRLVDVPGYGFAKTDEKTQAHWGKELDKYFSRRQSLVGIVLIIDSRRGITTLDEQLLEFIHHYPTPTHLLLTKCDKLKAAAQRSLTTTIKKQIKAYDIELSYQLFSALNRTGVEEAQAKIHQWLSKETA